MVSNDPNGQANLNRIGVGVAQITGEKRRVLAFYLNEYFRDLKLAVEKIREQLFTNSDSALLENFDRSITRIYSRKVL